MIGCYFDDIPVGTSLEITTESEPLPTCEFCKIPHDRRVWSGVYIGHATNGVARDEILLDEPFPCPSCGNTIRKYAHKCDAIGIWPIFAAVEQEQPQ